jgi:hypothetical protein
MLGLDAEGIAASILENIKNLKSAKLLVQN